MHKSGGARAQSRTCRSGAHLQKRRRAEKRSREEHREEQKEKSAGRKKSGDNTNYKTSNIFAASAACGAIIAALPQPGKGIIGLTGQ